MAVALINEYFSQIRFFGASTHNDYTDHTQHGDSSNSDE